jgi:nitrate/nitrite-specific signal transduction histidine kinase
MLQRRWILNASAGALLVGAVGAPMVVRAQVQDVNDAINKAGRQRMLSQRMAKAWLMLAHQADANPARQALAQSIKLFERQLAELKAYAPQAEIRTTYTELEGAWGAYKTVLTTAQPSKAAASGLLQADAKVLALAHQGTVLYEAASGKPVGHLVNVAGRQRMLSQRMAKFCLAAMLQVDAATSTTDIDKARKEFLSANELLRTAPQATDRIRQELQLADGQWVFFDAALQRMQTGANTFRQVSEVFMTSENLLASMDRITGMYAALAA